MRRLYRSLCQRFGPEGLTLSAYAWKVFATTGDTFWRNRIDGLWLLLFGQEGHCQSQHQRERRSTES